MSDSPDQPVVCCNKRALMERAEQLAERLGWPLVSQQGDQQLALVLDEDGFALHQPSLGKTPLRVDFHNPQLAWRLRQGARQEALNKAIGSSKSADVSVLDATAGLGRDSLLIAATGARVTALERNPVMHCLLEAALQDASQSASLADIAARITLLHADASRWMANQQSASFDVVYLDPMFPAREKSARVKKDMQLLHALLGPAEDGERLLDGAFQLAGKRVVVKRPRLAPHLAGKTPSHQLTGRSSRFDIYAV